MTLEKRAFDAGDDDFEADVKGLLGMKLGQVGTFTFHPVERVGLPRVPCERRPRKKAVPLCTARRAGSAIRHGFLMRMAARTGIPFPCR